MAEFSLYDINEMHHLYRINLINSCNFNISPYSFSEAGFQQVPGSVGVFQPLPEYPL